MRNTQNKLIGNNYQKHFDQTKKHVKKLNRIPFLSVVAQFDLPESTKKIIINQKKTISDMLVHNKFCSKVISDYGGRVIKELGDAVLVIFPSVPSACKCGLDVIHYLRKHGHGICTKVVVTAGDIEEIKTRCEPDIYGTPVNLCNRMSKYADPDSVLIEDIRFFEVHAWLSDDPKIRFCPIINRNLKEFGNRSLRKLTLK